MNTIALGHALRARRRELGISQRDLSDLAGVALHTVSDVESGKGNPTLSTVVALLAPLGLKLDVRIREL